VAFGNFYFFIFIPEIAQLLGFNFNGSISGMFPGELVMAILRFGKKIYSYETSK